MKKLICIAVLLLLSVPLALAQDLTFSKSKYSSPNLSKEVDVTLTVSDAQLAVKATDSSGVDLTVPYASIDSLTYEEAARHRIKESKTVGMFSKNAALITMATKTKSHFLDIEYHDGATHQVLTLHMDKAEYKDIIAALEKHTGKQVQDVKAKESAFNPTADSKDIDETIPYQLAAVVEALKPAMENYTCHVTQAAENRIECKRDPVKGGEAERIGVGSEEIRATLEPLGDQTRVRIVTDKGMKDRSHKKNWSTPIYQGMMENLQKPPESAQEVKPQ